MKHLPRSVRKAQILGAVRGSKGLGCGYAQIAKACDMSNSPSLRNMVSELCAEGLVCWRRDISNGGVGYKFMFWCPEFGVNLELPLMYSDILMNDAARKMEISLGVLTNA